MRRLVCTLLGLAAFMGTAGFSWAAPQGIDAIGTAVLDAACGRLGIGSHSEDVACLTNAGYARWQGRSTRAFYDLIPQRLKISLGRGNLLAVHDRPEAPLWFAFAQKRSDGELMMVCLNIKAGKVEASEAFNGYIGKKQSFTPFSEVLGAKAFAIITLANGWADGLPEELLQAALFHDHLCCGVFTGQSTADFIRKRLPLEPGQTYTYIGVPAWCQDDYLMMALNLTPGKHGYYCMAYPWARPWQAGEKSYDHLGGILIRFDNARATGSACVLRYNWQEEEFKTFLGMPDLVLDWRTNPWLHAWYIRFGMQYLDAPEHFVSVFKQVELNSRDDLDRLTRMGAQPLAILLGPDPAWQP